MTYRVEQHNNEPDLVPNLAFAAVDGRMGEDSKTGESRPLVFLAMGVLDENHRMQEAYYALSGHETLVLIGGLRAAGARAFGQGFVDSAQALSAMTLEELNAWLTRGGDLRSLGRGQ